MHVATAKPRYINYKHFITLREDGTLECFGQIELPKEKTLLAIMQILLNKKNCIIEVPNDRTHVELSKKHQITKLLFELYYLGYITTPVSFEEKKFVFNVLIF